jgi:hypothetical protein
MAIHEIEPQAEPQLPQITIWQIYEENGEMLHHLIIDGQDTGVVDWEQNRAGLTGFIDGLDAEKELDFRGIRKLAWLPIAECMRQIHPEVKHIVHLDGEVWFGAIKPEDFGIDEPQAIN